MTRDQQRAELHRTIWGIAACVKRENELRAQIDAILDEVMGS